jgi:hypothetical protein
VPASKDLLEGFRALDDAAADYRQAATYFSGTPVERFANQHIERLVRGTGPYRFRLAHRPVNAMTSRVRIAAVTSDSTAATARIDVIRTANDMVRLEPLIHRKTFMYGDAYVMAWPVDREDVPEVGEGTDAPVDKALRESGVELSYQSPLSCRVMYEGEDGRRPRFAIRRWQEDWLGGKVWRAELWYPGDPAWIEDWVTLPGSNGGAEDDWRAYSEDESGREMPVTVGTPDSGGNWPMFHDWDLPIKHARTDMPYGVPEHIDAYGPQDAINKLLITQVNGIEAYGWPDRWSLVDDQAVLDQARVGVNWDDDAEAPAASVRRARTQPGASTGAGGKEIRHTGVKAVGEYSQPDPTAMVSPVDQYVRLMAAATGTALSEFDPSTDKVLSGAAQRAADKPQRDRELDRKLYLEGFWKEVWQTALDMDGTEPGTITIQWAPGEVNTDPDWWATAQTRLLMGVPLRQILLEANYLPDEVDKWLDQDGSEEAALDQRITRLTALGTALQGIGTAQALGVVSPEQVAALVNQIMGQAGVPEGVPTEITPPQPPPGQGDDDDQDEEDPEA